MAPLLVWHWNRCHNVNHCSSNEVFENLLRFAMKKIITCYPHRLETCQARDAYNIREKLEQKLAEGPIGKSDLTLVFLSF